MSDKTTPAKLAEIDRALATANHLVRLLGRRWVPCQWKIEAFLQDRQP